jgi:predicted Zn-dependent protease
VAEGLSREAARRLADRALGFSRAEGCQVSIGSGVDGNTRFAANQISTSGDTTNAVLTVSSRFGKRQASASTNVFDDAGLRRAVETSERLARLAPENPELMPLLPPQSYEDVTSSFAVTERLDAAARADAARVAADACEAAGLTGAGFIQRTAGSTAVANSAGLFAHRHSSEAAYTLTVRTRDGQGSGWAGTTHNDWARLTPAGALAERAIAKARGSREPVTLEPGKYAVVLEPTAVGNLLGLMTFAMNARAADEGRSFFAKRGGGTKLGERVVDERVTILSDPRDPDLLEQPFTGEGLPVGRTVWIENGVLKNLAYDRFWADRKGVRPVPFGGGIRLDGGTATTEELIAQVPRGLLVTRFWYIRGVDQRSLLFTGLTRDGLFLIENGKVSTAVRNFRFNESPVIMLNNLEAIGRPQRVAASESGGVGASVVVPPLLVREFTFTSISEAV